MIGSDNTVHVYDSIFSVVANIGHINVIQQSSCISNGEKTTILRICLFLGFHDFNF